MFKEIMLTMLVLFTIIPVWPAILYHVGKGLLDDCKNLWRS